MVGSHTVYGMMPESDVATRCSKLLQQPLRCLILGANGTGMSALSDILVDLGHQVVGLDSSVSHNKLPGYLPSPRSPVLPWKTDSIPPDIDLCITTPAVEPDDRVITFVRQQAYPTITLHQCLAILFAESRQICVAGTHGKSTTSAMLASILEAANLQPGFFVGARMSSFERSGRAVSGLWSVLESCEFQESFRNLKPQITVLTGIERDHFDYFPDQQSEDAAFRNFAGQTAADGTIVYFAECERSRQIAAQCSQDQISVGIGSSDSPVTADWSACEIRYHQLNSSFICRGPDGEIPVVLPLPGEHNVRNAIAAIATASRAGISAETSAAALRSFRGIERRFQLRGDYGGVLLIDDYAHHPTAIRSTLRAVRQSYPGRRVLVAFEPHQMVRTEALFSDFVASLSEADESWVLPVFPAREKATHLECCRLSGQLVKQLNRCGTKAFLFANLDQVASRVDHSGRQNDILITMGAGRTNLIHDELNRRLQRYSVA